MIVSCEKCSTKFKIPDEKVTEKGVKVRCTKCSHTFRVSKPASGAATTTGPLDDPFAKFGGSGAPPPVPSVPSVPLSAPQPRISAPAQSFELGDGDFEAPTRVGDISSLIAQSTARAPAPQARPEPLPIPKPQSLMAPAPPEKGRSKPFDIGALELESAPEPQESSGPKPFDFGDLGGAELEAAPPPPAAAAKPFDFGDMGGSELEAPVPMSTPAPAALPKIEAPSFAAAASQKPTMASARAPAAVPASSADDRFDIFGGGSDAPPPSGEALPEAAPAEGPVDTPEGLDFGGNNSVNDDISSLFGDAPPIDTSPAPKRAAATMPGANAGASPVAVARISLKSVVAVGGKPLVPEPIEEVSSTAVDLVPPNRRRAVNAVMATLLALIFLGVGGVFLNDGRFDLSFFKSLATSQPYVAGDISNGLYDTESGRPVFFVRGSVSNTSDEPKRLGVTISMLEGDHVLREASSVAGVAPSPEAMFKLGSAAELETLLATLGEKAEAVPPRATVPFVVPFYEYPTDLKGFRVKVVVAALAPKSTASR